jgi:hypothetical protein
MILSKIDYLRIINEVLCHCSAVHFTAFTQRVAETRKEVEGRVHGRWFPDDGQPGRLKPS